MMLKEQMLRQAGRGSWCPSKICPGYSCIRTAVLAARLCVRLSVHVWQ